MVGISLHEDGLALSSKSLDTVYALPKLCRYSVSCQVLEETDMAYGTISGVVEGTAVATANIATTVLCTAPCLLIAKAKICLNTFPTKRILPTCARCERN
jgi:hypothetical protein